jgi:hypothetical protein
MTQERKNFEAF